MTIMGDGTRITAIVRPSGVAVLAGLGISAYPENDEER
jgi:hypothetical protein